jgi:MFS family permease
MDASVAISAHPLPTAVQTVVTKRIGPPAIPQTTMAHDVPLLGLIALGFVGMGALEASAGVLWADVLRGFGVSEAGFGLAMAVAVGLAFPVMIFGGRLADRVDKRLLLSLAFLLLAAGSFGLAIASGALALVAILAVRGLGISLTDLSNFALAMDYERDHRRHIMGPVLAGISVGGMLGPIAVWVAFGRGSSYPAVSLGLVAFYGTAALAALQLVRRRPHLPCADAQSSPPAFGLLRRADLRILAALCGLGFLGEMLATQWVGLYLREDRSLDATVAVLALGAYAATMLVARLANGAFLARLGPARMLAIDGGLILAGGAALASGGPPAIAVTGCAIMGMGLAGVVPTALSQVGALVPAATGAATGAVMTVGYLAFVFGPAAAGALAAATSLRVVIASLVLAGVAVTALATRLDQGALTCAGLMDRASDVPLQAEKRATI